MRPPSRAPQRYVLGMKERPHNLGSPPSLAKRHGGRDGNSQAQIVLDAGEDDPYGCDATTSSNDGVLTMAAQSNAPKKRAQYRAPTLNKIMHHTATQHQTQGGLDGGLAPAGGQS